jgi:hypothetical protein
MHKFKRSIQKLVIKVWRVMNIGSGQMSEYEQDATNICRKLLMKPDSVLLLSPISGKRFIKSEDGEVFIVISERAVDITNHQYNYNIPIGDKTQIKLRAIFDNEVEKRREVMESEIKSNVKHSLKTIYQHLAEE